MNIDITAIENWFQIAKPEPTIEDVCTQIGCHWEECGEMALSLCDVTLEREISRISDAYKSKSISSVVYLENADATTKIELLDSLCDQIITAIGVAKMMGFDIGSALNEVNRSNWSKFVDGKAVFDENGKIAKPDTYSRPGLTRFIECK